MVLLNASVVVLHFRGFGGSWFLFGTCAMVRRGFRAQSVEGTGLP